MNQRVHNLTKWRFLPEGRSLHYAGDKPRTVIIDVNCPGEVCFYVRQDRDAVLNDEEIVRDEAAGRARPDNVGLDPSDDELVFIGLVKGRDRLEFAVSGAFDLLVEGGSAYVYSAEGQDIATRVVAPVIFTRIANRRQRNPHLEMMEYQMRLNVQRMRAELEEETERRVGALERKVESYAPERDIRAPPERVGRPPGWDAGAEREPEDATAPNSDVADEGPVGGDVPRKRRKTEAAEEL